jgi:pimeloyl-ACP methyl ester carboxylesterase
MPVPKTRYFRFEGNRLAYAERGDGEHAVVLLHGLLLSKRMHRALARELAERGYRVISLDLLGHGESDQPVDMTQHSMQRYGKQAIALLDHLGIEQAVFFGTSLGANTALEAAVLAPERVRGMVIEMPVLDNAIIATGVAFLPVMIAMRFGAPLIKASSALARRVPTSGLGLLETVWDWPTREPEPSLAVLQGLFFDRIAPPKGVRRTIAAPALVIGHPNDPVHPFADSDELVRDLPNARLLEASSIVELRTKPERLTGEIAAFVDECWARKAPAKRPRAKGTAAKGTAAKRTPTKKRGSAAA